MGHEHVVRKPSIWRGIKPLSYPMLSESDVIKAPISRNPLMVVTPPNALTSIQTTQREFTTPQGQSSSRLIALSRTKLQSKLFHNKLSKLKLSVIFGFSIAFTAFAAHELLPPGSSLSSLHEEISTETQNVIMTQKFSFVKLAKSIAGVPAMLFTMR